MQAGFNVLVRGARTSGDGAKAMSGATCRSWGPSEETGNDPVILFNQRL